MANAQAQMEEIKAQVERGINDQKLVEIPRHILPVLKHIFVGFVPAVFFLLATVPILILGYKGWQLGLDSLFRINAILVLILSQVALICMLYGVVEFFNNWILKDPTSGEFLIGFRYTIDYINGQLVAEDAGFLTRQVRGVVMQEGSVPHLDLGGFTLYYENAGRRRHLTDIRTVIVASRNIIAKFFDFGDVYVAVMEEGGDFLLKNVRQPEKWQMLLLAASEKFKSLEEQAAVD